jgi:hypothetical protein
MNSKVKTGFIHYVALCAAIALAVASVFLHRDTFSPSEDGIVSGALAQNRADEFSMDGRYDDQIAPKAAFEKGQRIITTLVLDGAFSDEQVVVYHNGDVFEGSVFLTQIKFSPEAGEYVRVMDAVSAANVADTVGLTSNDLVGDHSVCVLLSGLNAADEHTLTVFRKPEDGVFEKIGEFVTDGIISVVETARGVNYDRGVTNGASFAITTRGRDMASANEMDQIEVTYRYNPASNRYEMEKSVAIPGAVIEDQRQRAILSGNRARFEEFVSGLWYHVSAEGTVNTRQYVYIAPGTKEITFYGDDRQEVFSWISTTQTRYGLYLVANNIAVTTLRRYIDIEMESLDSIRLKVVEDVRMKIDVNAPWDGSYRKAPQLRDRTETVVPPVSAFIDDEYEGSLGKITFTLNGDYRIESGSLTKIGKYAFFLLGSGEFLELRQKGGSGEDRIPREVYAVARDGAGIVLSRVRVGVKRIERYREDAIALYH